MSLTQANQALIKTFSDNAFFDAAHTAHENVAFDIPNGEAWCQLFFVPGEPTVATLGAGGTDRYDGFLQIDLKFPVNVGTKDISDKYELIRNVFTAGKRYAYSGQEVVLKSCGRSQGRTKDGVYTVSVSAYFYCFVTRP